MASLRLRSNVDQSDVWTLVRVSTPARGRRTTALDGVLAMIDSSRVRLIEAFDAVPAPRKQRRTVVPGKIDIAVAARPGEHLVLMARHPSGAVAFYVADETGPARRRGSATLHFHVPVSKAAPPSPRGRRGDVGAAVRMFLFNAVAPLATRALTVLARNWETRTWQKSGKAEGWVRVLGNDDATFGLRPVRLDAAELGSGPCLLLLHGTFSDTAGSFAALARSGLLRSVRMRYADRIFAYEHFSVSRSPAENLRALLDALPAGRHTFDVIGYSRGALLCRMLLEQAAQLGSNGDRFALGRAVLIEGPLRGTALARAARYRELLGWIANLLEMFPGNPLTTAAAWLTDGIVWLAHRLSGALPGIAAMDPDGALLGVLTKTEVPDERYFAVAADYQATQGIRARLLDVAADGFFAGANDLVVPTIGCYELGHAESSAIAENRRIVFGKALAGDDGPGSVHHLNAVGQSRTARFATAVLTATRRRGTAAGNAREPEPARPIFDEQTPSQRIAISIPAVGADPTFHILVLSKGGGGKPRPDMVLATWNGARVKQPFNWSESDARGAGERWSRIVAMHKRLLAYFSGEPGKELPDETALRRFGRSLFETLMAGEVGRLYDEARGQVGAARLIVVLTSDAESGRWAEKPWEFAFDPARRTWFAMEDVHLIRDVLGAVPADVLPAHAPPLRLLVAYAQPIDAQALSVGDERKVILRAFQPLIDAGLAQVDVLPRATPAALQACLERAQYDVLHFVGHGAFDEDKQRGLLLFEDDRHNSQLLYESQFRQIVANRGLRLVFLNACESGRGGYADFNRGVAPALLSVGIPAAVANQFSVFDSAAVSFAQNLYARLALGRTLAEAMREARIALNYSLDGTNIDWAVPILFTRVPSLRLCTVPASTTAADVLSTLPVAVPSRAAVRRHRVGVWDVSRRLPGLEAVVERMNRAQGEIELVLVDVAVPLAAGVMTKKRSDGGTRYLNADAARSRLRRLPLELKLDLLVGFTHQRMVSEETTDVFAVWGADADGADNSVALLSIAGFDFPSSGEMADAFVVNGLVGAIAGVVCGLDSHKDGERRCPLYYNARRELALLVGRQRFDPRVRRAIRRNSPRLLTALDALLAKVPARAANRINMPRAKARRQDARR